MPLLSVLQRTLHTLSPWTQHWLQNQNPMLEPVRGTRGHQPTTIQLKPVDAQLRFTAQSQRVERFADNIASRHTPRPIVNTVQRERQTDSRIQLSTPLPVVSRQPAPSLDRSLSPLAPIHQGESQAVVTSELDSWIMREPQPSQLSNTEVEATDSFGTDGNDYREATEQQALVTDIAQRPQLLSIAEQIEQRIQRAAALRRGEAVALPAISTAKNVEPPLPSSNIAEIQRRIEAAQFSAPLLPVDVDSTRGQPASPADLSEPPVATPASYGQDNPPSAVDEPRPASNVVAEIQRRIAQAAQAQLQQPAIVQRQSQEQQRTAPPAIGDVRSTSLPLPSPSPTSAKLPPQVRRMRAISQIEEIGAQARGADKNLPLAVPATASDFTKTTKPDVPPIAEERNPTIETIPSATVDETMPSSALAHQVPSATASSSAPPAVQSGQEVPAIQRNFADANSQLTSLPEPSALEEDATTPPLSTQQSQAVAAMPMVMRTESEPTVPTTVPENVQPVDERGLLDSNVAQSGFNLSVDTETVDGAIAEPLQPAHGTDKAVVQRSTVKSGQSVQMQRAENELAPNNQSAMTLQRTHDVPNTPPLVAATKMEVDRSVAEIADETLADLPLQRSVVWRPQQPETAPLKPEQEGIAPLAESLSERLTQLSSDRMSVLATSAQSDALVVHTPVSQQSALAMPLVNPTIQRQSRQTPSVRPQVTMAEDNTDVQPYSVSALARSITWQQAHSTDSIAEQPARSSLLVAAVPSIERRIDLSTLKPTLTLNQGLPASASPAIQRQPVAAPSLPQMVDMSVTDRGDDESTALNLDDLARAIMPMVKRMISVEREREPVFE